MTAALPQWRSPGGRARRCGVRTCPVFSDFFFFFLDSFLSRSHADDIDVRGGGNGGMTALSKRKHGELELGNAAGSPSAFIRAAHKRAEYLTGVLLHLKILLAKK